MVRVLMQDSASIAFASEVRPIACNARHSSIPGLRGEETQPQTREHHPDKARIPGGHCPPGILYVVQDGELEFLVVGQQAVAIQPTELLQRLVLNLADALTADLQLLAHLGQRVLVALTKAKAKLQNQALAGA